MIEIVRWDDVDRNIEEYHQRKIDRNNHLLFREVLQEANFSAMQPYSVEIETVNRCNNDCSFCAVNIRNDTRPYKKMSEELFYEIIEQLARMNYRGYLSLFSNNEPLLDQRIYDFLEHARKKVPNARLCLFTNGILLNAQRLGRLIENLDYLTIDNYEDSGTLLPSVAAALEPFYEKQFACRVKVFIRRKTQVLSSRGGESPNRTMDVAYEGTCMMPFMQIVIRPDGKISKCCQDGLGFSCIGDLTKETLQECWRNEKRSALWTTMASEGRRGVVGCQYCDVFGHDNYLPDEWKPTIVQAFVKIVAMQVMERKQLILIGTEPGRSKIQRLLHENGIYVKQICESAETLPTEENTFYILGTYEEPFLEKLDPRSEQCGKSWIVYEKIPEYIYHDRTEAVLGFAKIMNCFFRNRKKELCYWGDDASLMLLHTYLELPEFCRVDEKENIRAHIKGREASTYFLLAGDREEEFSFLTEELGLRESQVICFSSIMDFMELL